MRTRFLKAASSEMRKAACRYEQEAIGLGEHFLSEVQSRVDYLVKFPNAGKVIGDLRAISIKTFPFSIFYGVYEEELVVVAVAHHRRRPGYWRRRKGK